MTVRIPSRWYQASKISYLKNRNLRIEFPEDLEFLKSQILIRENVISELRIALKSSFGNGGEKMEVNVGNR